MAYRFLSVNNCSRLPALLTLSCDSDFWIHGYLNQRKEHWDGESYQQLLSRMSDVRDFKATLPSGEFRVDLKEDTLFPSGASIRCTCEIPGYDTCKLDFIYDADSNETFTTRFLGNPFFQDFYYVDS